MKKILVTGNEGYIGCVLTDKLMNNGYEVVGLDIGIFKDSKFVPRGKAPTNQLYKDIRQVEARDLRDVYAVVHLAGLSNDPLGSLNPELTYEINHKASVRLAKIAKEAGVKRLLFSSSCSIYGASDDKLVSEESEMDPKTPYADSKVKTEKDISCLADNNFTPIFLRNSTVFGVSPRMRLDLVVHNLLAHGYLNGVITVLSDGLPWRPLVHIEDVADAFCFLLEAPLGDVHNQAFNIGHKENNVQVKDIVEMAQKIMPNTIMELKNEAPSDARTYKVDFSKIYSLGFSPQHSVQDGVEEVYNTFRAINFSKDDFENDYYVTIKRYQNKINLDDWLLNAQTAVDSTNT